MQRGIASVGHLDFVIGVAPDDLLLSAGLLDFQAGHQDQGADFFGDRRGVGAGDRGNTTNLATLVGFQGDRDRFGLARGQITQFNQQLRLGAAVTHPGGDRVADRHAARAGTADVFDDKMIGNLGPEHGRIRSGLLQHEHRFTDGNARGNPRPRRDRGVTVRRPRRPGLEPDLHLHHLRSSKIAQLPDQFAPRLGGGGFTAKISRARGNGIPHDDIGDTRLRGEGQLAAKVSTRGNVGWQVFYEPDSARSRLGGDQLDGRNGAGCRRWLQTCTTGPTKNH